MVEPLANGPNRNLLVIAITVAGLITGALALIAFLIGWESADSAPWRTAATVGAAVCAVIGVLFAIIPGGRR